MVNNWVFVVASILIIFGDLLYLNVLRMQLRLFKQDTPLNPLKKLLLSAVVFLILGSLPLLFVYVNTYWFHERSIWYIYIAVIVNAISKVVVGLMLNAVYRFRVNDMDLGA